MASSPQLGGSLVIRSPNWLGDAVMTLPAVHQLMLHVGDSCRISVLAPRKLFEVWKLVEGIESLIPVEKSVLRTAAEIRKQKFQAAVIFPNSLRSGLEMALGLVPYRIGFRGHSRSFLLTKAFDKKIPKSGIRHQSLDYLDLVAAAGVEIDHGISLPVIQPPPRPAVEKDYAVLCPGAEYGPAKRWPAERFAEVGDWIARKYGCQIIILGAPVDAEIATQVSSKMKTPSENLAGKTSLAEFIQYLAHAKVAVCNDSGSMHLAAFLGTHTVAIFGSTEQRLTGPLGEYARVVREHAPCSPCFLRECPIDFRCMTNIDSKRITSEVESLLES